MQEQPDRPRRSGDCHLKTINSLKQVPGPPEPLKHPGDQHAVVGQGGSTLQAAMLAPAAHAVSLPQEVATPWMGSESWKRKVAVLRYDSTCLGGFHALAHSCPVVPPTCGPTRPQPPSCLSPQLKDLKRQLHLERNGADKLQERLQDILTNSKSRSGEGPRAQGG